jgi:hypothetical protein
MGVVQSGAGIEEAIGGDRICHGNHWHAPRESLEKIGELPLEMEAGGDDEIGAGEPVGIARGGLVAVGIDPRRHQAVDADPIAGDLADEISHHRRRSHDMEATIGSIALPLPQWEDDSEDHSEERHERWHQRRDAHFFDLSKNNL